MVINENKANKVAPKLEDMESEPGHDFKRDLEPTGEKTLTLHGKVLSCCGSFDISNRHNQNC